MINLDTLMEKTPDGDLLREMIGFAAQRLMELDVEGQTGARPTARRARSVCRSATMTFDRIWENPRRWRRTAHLQAAQGLLLPGFWIPLHVREGAHAVVQKTYVQGVSTRLVDDLVQAMGMTGISKKQLHEQTSDARITLRG
jgi:putative transposase